MCTLTWLLFRSEEHTSELQSYLNLVCRLLLEKKRAHVWTPVTRESRVPSSVLAHHRARAQSHSRTRLCRTSISCLCLCVVLFFFFFNDTATTEIYTLSLHDALPI